MYEHREENLMRGNQQQPPLDIEVLRWDAESFTIAGLNLELESLKGQKIPRLVLRHNGKIIDNLTGVIITRVYKHQDYRHRYEETEFRYNKRATHDPQQK
jgi:hypothetical protein